MVSLSAKETQLSLKSTVRGGLQERVRELGFPIAKVDRSMLGLRK